MHKRINSIQGLLDAYFVDLQVQFRNLLPQLGVPHLLDDVVTKDTNECYER